jgi:hypothetical protein
VADSVSEETQAADDATADADDSTVAAPAPSAGQQQQPVLRIAPKLVAPAELAWLTSAPLRLLAGHTPSQQLQQLMGWSLRQVLRPSVVIAQLMELGKMYPAGQVRRYYLLKKITDVAAHAVPAARMLFCCNCAPVGARGYVRCRPGEVAGSAHDQECPWLLSTVSTVVPGDRQVFWWCLSMHSKQIVTRLSSASNDIYNQTAGVRLLRERPLCANGAGFVASAGT